MIHWRWKCFALLAVAGFSCDFITGTVLADELRKGKSQPVVLVVMDPLVKEMACACVKGYGQRDYRKLAARLKASLKQPVSVEFSDDLAGTLKLTGSGREFIVVGDRSLVT